MTPYAAAWRGYRFWSRAFWLTFIAYLPVVASFDAVVRRRYGDAANTATMFMAFAWLIAFAATGHYRNDFTCPRCGEAFFRTWDDRPWRKSWRVNPFAGCCQHCGLPKWSETGQD